MKILQVITSMRTGGAEKLVADMTTIIKDEGHQVDILLFDGIDTHLKQKLTKEGISIYSLGINNWIYNPLFIIMLIPYLKKYDIIHTHNTSCQLYVAIASLFVKKNKRAKLITTEHSTTNRRRNIKIFKQIDKWMYRCYDCVVAISDKAREMLAEYSMMDNIRTIYNGVDLKKFNKSERNDSVILNSNEIKITMVAGLKPPKDQKTIIRALKLLPPKYHLYLVGDGETREDIETYIQSLALTERVHILGMRSDIPELLHSSDIIVMSSHYEGLSLSSIEGMASGRPFIASDVDGLHEITQGAGILFPEGDEKALATEIRCLIENKTHYEGTAKKCQERASHYSIELTAEKYLNIYTELSQ